MFPSCVFLNIFGKVTTQTSVSTLVLDCLSPLLHLLSFKNVISVSIVKDSFDFYFFANSCVNIVECAFC